MLGPSRVELEKKFFWIWFICTLEGCVLLWLYFFYKVSFEKHPTLHLSVAPLAIRHCDLLKLPHLKAQPTQWSLYSRVSLSWPQGQEVSVSWEKGRCQAFQSSLVRR